MLDPPFAEKQWDYGGPYSFANFDMVGDAKVRITSKRSLRDTIIRPVSKGVTPQIEDDHTLTIHLDRPRKLSIEPDGKNGPLLLFANPMEVDPPKPEQANVVYFGPGIHRPGKIEIGSGQTLYLAGGAVVKGGVIAQGDNIKICGRGILDGSDWEWRTGPTPTVIAIRGTNIEVSGITIRGASHWTIVPRHSRNVTVRNVKLCNSRVQNDDGINPCNSQDVLISDCFIRSDDDCVALKGLDFDGENNNVERITVENCILWCDRARIFLLGHESRAQFMRQGDAARLGHHSFHDDALPAWSPARTCDSKESQSRTSASTARDSGNSSAYGRRQPVHAQANARNHRQYPFRSRHAHRHSQAIIWCS